MPTKKISVPRSVFTINNRGFICCTTYISVRTRIEQTHSCNQVLGGKLIFHMNIPRKDASFRTPSQSSYNQIVHLDSRLSPSPFSLLGLITQIHRFSGKEKQEKNKSIRRNLLSHSILNFSFTWSGFLPLKHLAAELDTFIFEVFFETCSISLPNIDLIVTQRRVKYVFFFPFFLLLLREIMINKVSVSHRMAKNTDPRCISSDAEQKKRKGGKKLEKSI